MEFKPKNREWVKNAAIVFLAVLLVLTFFSNTIMNRTLPEVATAGVTDGSIVAKVRGSGTVKANGNHDVKTDQTREIRSVMVKVGQEVKTGDALFVLGAGDSQELEAAKDTLRDLQYSYQKAAVSMPNFDYTKLNREVTNAEKALDAADAKLSEAESLYYKMKNELGDASELQDLQKAEADMKAAYANLVAAQQNYDAKYQELSAEVVYWQGIVNEKTQAPVPTATPVPQPPEETDGGNEDGQQTSIDAAQLGGSEATGLSAVKSGGSYVNLTAVDSGGAYVPLSAAGDFGDPAHPEDMTLEQAKAWLAAAQNALSDFTKTNQATLTNAKAVYDTAKAKYDALVKYNDNKYYELVPYKEALDAAQAEYDTAYDAYEDAYAALYFTQTSNDKTLASASIDLQQTAEKIKLAQEKVKQLSGDSGDQITANVNGIVTSIGCSAGDTVTKDTILCTIEVPDQGHTLTFSVTNDQAQRLRVGDSATVSNYYWGKEIIATLSTIRTDPKNPQTNKELTFDITGDVTSGSELTISVGQKSANYDTIVPNSAIRSDNNGSFVLAIQAKSSPLGNRYIAKRVSVEVLASDDNNSAVVADLSYGDYVITTSNSPVKSGDQVRMAETGT